MTWLLLLFLWHLPVQPPVHHPPVRLPYHVIGPVNGGTHFA
jgi:hypothetical protein